MDPGVTPTVLVPDWSSIPESDDAEPGDASDEDDVKT